MNIHYSSASPEWYTPEAVLERVRMVAPIGLDPCSSGRDSVRAARSYTAADNGLAQPWIVESGTLVYVNPPYGRGIGPWVEKCYRSGQLDKSARIIALLPARVDTAWFQHVWNATAVCFVRGRLKFSGHTNAAPFPSALAYWGSCDWDSRFENAFRDLGRIIHP
jgi:site-specific DNA-methyltransferase (adenine-specific)